MSVASNYRSTQACPRKSGNEKTRKSPRPAKEPQSRQETRFAFYDFASRVTLHSKALLPPSAHPSAPFYANAPNSNLVSRAAIPHADQLHSDIANCGLSPTHDE